MVRLKIDLRRCTRVSELFSSLALLESLGERETIEFVCRRLVELLPGNALVVANYARALGNLGRIDQMRHYLAKAVELEPGNPFAGLLLGQMQVQDGNYVEGFLNREARWGTTERNYMIAELPIPWWRGQSLKGKRLLLFSETSLGIGDSIQYARYLLPLCERAASEGGLVYLDCNPELEGFYRRNFSKYSEVLNITSLPEKIRFVRPLDLLPVGGPPESFAKSALRSLTLIFGPPGAERFPYLRPDRERVEAWREKLALASAPGLKIGVAWTGRDDHPRADMRDYPVSLLAQALSGCGVKLYSLQLGAKETARAAGLIDLTAELTSIDETAALLANLDLIISNDGMLAHLAGALGRPTWTLVDVCPHYTWGLAGGSSPWYPAVRVFRQKQYKNWTSVFDEVRDALRARQPADSPLTTFDTSGTGRLIQTAS
jgi:Glycosyltransferase family 9 (heptosyltransferase)